MMDYRKFAAGLRSAAGSYALFYGAPRGDLEQAADVIEELAAKLEPSSEPLTLEELRGMDGEPVYVMDLTDGNPELTGYIVFRYHNKDGFNPRGGGWFYACGYGRTWLAYRRRPEEERKR